MTPAPEAPLRSNADVLAFWTKLLPAIDVSRRSVSVNFLDEDARPLPILIPIDDLPLEPHSGLLQGLASVISQVAGEGSSVSVVLLLTRPGPGTINGHDLRWATALHNAGLSDWPVHLATRGGVQAFTPDELAAAS